MAETPVTTADDQGGPATDFNRRSTQYPTMSKVENGMAYDITGKQLGPYDEGQAQQPSAAQPTPAPQQGGLPQTLPADYFEKQEAAAKKSQPAQTQQPTQSAQSSQSQGLPQTLPADYFEKKEAPPVASAPQREVYAPGAGATSIGPRKANNVTERVQDWLTDLKNDLDEGTDNTWVGWLMRKAGAKGLSYGNSPEVGHIIGGPLYGPVEMLHGSAGLQGKAILGQEGRQGTVKNINEVFSGVGHAAAPAMATQPEALPFLAIGAPAQKLGSEVAKSMGADEDVQELVGNVTGLVAAGKAVGKGQLLDHFEEHTNRYIGAQTDYQARVKEMETAARQSRIAEQQAQDARTNPTGQTTDAAKIKAAEENASMARSNAMKAQKAVEQAREVRDQAGVEMRKTARQIQGPKAVDKDAQKHVKDVAGVYEDLKMAAPKRGATAPTNHDLAVAHGYVENEHSAENPIDSVQKYHDAVDKGIDSIDQQIDPHIDRYIQEPISTNPRMAAHDALAKSTRTDFVQDGMKALEKYNLTDPTMGEARDMLTDMNAETRAIRKRNFWDQATARRMDAGYAAVEAASEALRAGIDGTLQSHGVEGIRPLRTDQASLIRVRDAFAPYIERGGDEVRGSGRSNAYREAAAFAAEKGTTLLGAKIGGPKGAMAGNIIGGKLGEKFNPSNISRDALIERAMKVRGAGKPMGMMVGEGTPSILPASEMPPIPGAQLSDVDMRHIQRENSPLHSALASHYGEDAGQIAYGDLEKQFMDDVNDKRQHGIKLDPDEQRLLVKMNDQNTADRLIAAQKAAETEASGKTIGQFNEPDKVEPLLQVPKNNTGLNTQEMATHELAHAVVLNEVGLNLADGVWSHLHPDSPSGNLMTAPIDWTEFVDKEGNIDPKKLTARIYDLATAYVAGGVANDLYHNVPFTESRALGTDIDVIKSYMKASGMSELEASKAISQAAENAAMILSRPGMQDILEGHASVREAGLNEKYHFSPERIEQVLQDVKEGTTRESRPGKSSGPVRPGDRATEIANERNGTKAKEVLQGQPEKQNAAGNRQGGEAVGANKERPTEGAAVTRTAEPASTTNPGVSAEPITPENPAVSRKTRESALRENWNVQGKDANGDAILEQVKAFSHADAMNKANKAFPTAQYMSVSREEVLGPKPTAKYEVPSEEHLSLPKFSREPGLVMRHELGHFMVGHSEGMETSGILRHTHPTMHSYASAAVEWNPKGILENGRVRGDKLAGLLKTIAGGIAQDEIGGTPRAQNANYDPLAQGSDGSKMRMFLRQAGMTYEQSTDLINSAIDAAKRHLTQPHIADIIQENADVREPGLSKQYHFSPERLQSMGEEAQRRGQNGTTRINNRAVAGQGNGNGQGNVGTGEGGFAPGIAAEVPRIATNEVVPPERTTGEHDEAIKAAGAIPGGIQKGFEYTDKATGQPKQYPDTVLFHDPQSGTTLALKAPELTADKVRESLANSRAQYAAAQGIKPENPAVSTDRVSTRVPVGKNATENPLEGEPLVVGREALSRAPEALQKKFAETVRKYPGVKIPKNIKEPVKVMDHFVRHVADNLKYLYDQVTPEKQTNNAKWYESANKLSRGLSEQHGVTEPQAAGVIATQSPQKDWDMNVSLARRITDIYKNQKDTVTTPEMMQKGRDIVKSTGANEDLGKVLPQLEGKKFSELGNDDYARAAWIRLYDEAHNTRDFHYIDPGTGENRGLRTNANGAPSKVAWGSLPQIDNAISILDNGSRQNISDRVGTMHKVRNFYNNIIDPTNNQDVTIDTHAVAAGLIQPLGGSATEVLHNFGAAGKHIGTGTMGTYPLYADAYRTAAAELGIKPRELQSVVWEHVREMFPSEWKSPESEKQVKSVWRKYSDGKQSLDATRKQILAISEEAQNTVNEARAETRRKAEAKAQKALDKQAKMRQNNIEAGTAVLGSK